jgi:hypothetical protein
MGVRLSHWFVLILNKYPSGHLHTLYPIEKIVWFGQLKHVLSILLEKGVYSGHVVVLNLVVYANTMSL